MRVKWVFAGLGAVAALFVLGAAALYLSLAGPIGWEPPEVAPLPSGPPFEADEIVLLDDGYVVAGVAGTSEPGLDDRCSGRFALVELADDGSARRAVVASGLERYRSCAHRVEAVFPDDAGGWLLSGSGARRAKPSSIFPGPGTDHPWFTLRFSGDGEPDEDFGDGGVARDALVVGRAEGALVTYLRHRVTDEGDVRGDLLVEPDRVTVGWSTIVAGERFFVAIESGPALTFQTFVVDGAEDPVRFRALDPRPYDARPRPTVDLGSAVLNAGDLALHDGVLYVVIDGRSPRVFAVDPHERQLVASFGRGGSASLPVRELVTSAGVAVDGRGRPLVVFTTLDHVHGTRLHARRYSPDGALDPTFGGLVKELGKGSDLDVARVLVDRSGHVLVFGALDSVLIRLTRAGRLDPSFGDDGAVSLGAADVCELAPASGSEACG